MPASEQFIYENCTNCYRLQEIDSLVRSKDCADLYLHEETHSFLLT